MSTKGLIKWSSTYFIILSLIKLSYAMAKIYNVLMMKFGRSWISKMSSLNSLAVIGNYKATMIVIIFVYPLLSDPSTSAKTYRSILKILDNGKKIPLILPLLFTGRFVTTFYEKLLFLIISLASNASQYQKIAFCR